MLGTLYIIATPIGNLEDVTLRAIEILKEVDIVLAEDTRVTKKLLDFVFFFKSKLTAHHPQLISYHQHSGEEKKLEILNYLLQGKNIALVTDAGTPGISDPGNELIDYLLSYKPELKIIPIPGASAITTALSVSGFRADKFVFIGFLPKKKKEKLFKWLKEGKITFAFYESPHRILKTLETLEGAFGSYTRVFIARELTKLYETLYRGKIKDVIASLKKEKVKGELTVVVEV
ncbi:16S rRNA (cytidine(1402)-2'-O)-methyltransferase [Candidatus Woesebacteria bacterium RIFCSPHIGHO2_01_FULL_39_32]|uniref:Ribosomal RNA small subunit methyltransferase I n=1 Tax=Candidatus Woesebacteria bacterium RIFCSPLOWO2_01_FULL_39_25 TaxID=1802521 RepID=A0A1F8BK32_9BACT|nr:MAG: 16S rRNA (cytidine(1402)-2'-O)-methyltransferase [Candidatus Woesebacteria bacterium GWB1_37_5]OGM24088.1 MAG: 16S rRNA (cytidine(1402)-2'-O)-methyltransferase [Candidatus Woesebacteria bacterium RIFCSPHIGHO2_01_FULL_39_32]OGM37933.1 MAG: 16S rRNA (cytidine(1402)-2'-O)-methyltransferase [Candidatus Woesebacteria bacterium RIFCSPHIGHO2_12_FULL_38_11]OGM64431.1 MAG: 16S rRNA (cytidine(1402)-2'-O)-methyltransferase [Candidatus Woesebacteria bacterium RIFCSPLOWO2_01_FULL_39_25]